MADTGSWVIKKVNGMIRGVLATFILVGFLLGTWFFLDTMVASIGNLGIGMVISFEFWAFFLLLGGIRWFADLIGKMAIQDPKKDT